jgi:hypothetical protein
MPKKFSIVVMREWLRRYEEGEPEVSIATKAHCDVRTMKKGLEVARREREVASARTELLKESLWGHQKDLMHVVDGLRSTFVMPAPDLMIGKDKYGAPLPIALPGARAHWLLRTGFAVDVSGEDTTLWKLLRQHLEGDPVWGHLDSWKSLMSAHLGDRVALRDKTAWLLAERTGFQVIEDGGATPEKDFIYGVAVDFWYHVYLQWALVSKDEAFLKKHIEGIRVTPTGYVERGQGSPVIAYAPGSQEECSEAIIKALEELQESSEIENVKASFKVIEPPMSKARVALEDISLLRFVPGRCRVCRLLGM